jgi:hypothetical protein
MLNATELVQWENGKSANDIAASQGIRIRRHCRPTSSLKMIEEELGASRNILEKIIWDKEIEVAEVCSCSLKANQVYCVQLSTDLLSCLATQIVKRLGSWIWDHCSLEIEMLVYSLYI